MKEGKAGVYLTKFGYFLIGDFNKNNDFYMYFDVVNYLGETHRIEEHVTGVLTLLLKQCKYLGPL